MSLLKDNAKLVEENSRLLDSLEEINIENTRLNFINSEMAAKITRLENDLEEFTIEDN